MPLGKRVFSKTAHRIFLKLLMKLGCLNGKKQIRPGFRDNDQKHQIKNRVFEFCEKNSPLMFRFFSV